MKKPARILVITVASVLLAVAALLTVAHLNFEKHRGLRYSPLPDLELAPEMGTADLETGRRIALIRNACTDCHGADLSGQVFIDGPPGKFAGSNITSSALAAWSDAEIARAIHSGVGRDGRPLLMMPSDQFRNLSRQDIASLIKYLRSTKGVDAPNIENEVRPLAKILFLLGQFPMLFTAEVAQHDSSFGEKPAEAPTAEFGRYMVQTSCAGCHGAQLAGGKIPGAPPDWPEAADIRASAIASWGEEGFTRTMKTGTNPSGKSLRFPMPVELTKQMNETELKAIWLYLTKI